MRNAPETIDVMMSFRGDLSVCSDGSPLDGGPRDRHVEYVRADRIEALEAENARLREALADMVSVAEFAEWDSALTGRDLVLRAARDEIGRTPSERVTLAQERIDALMAMQGRMIVSSPDQRDRDDEERPEVERGQE